MEASFTVQKSVAYKFLKPGLLDTAPKVVRVSVMDPYATDDEAEAEDEGKTHHPTEKKVVNEIRMLESQGVSSRRTATTTATTTKLRGVRERSRGRWGAEIRDPVKQTRMWLGTYDTAEEAAMAYDREAIRLKGSDAITNFIKPPEKKKSVLMIKEDLNMDIDMYDDVTFDNNVNKESEDSSVITTESDENVSSHDSFSPKESHMSSCGKYSHDRSIESPDLTSPSSAFEFMVDADEVSQSESEIRQEHGWECEIREDKSSQYSFLFLDSNSTDCYFDINQTPPPSMFFDEMSMPHFIYHDKSSDISLPLIEDFEPCNNDIGSYFNSTELNSPLQ